MFAVNKMDLVGFAEETFRSIESDLHELGSRLGSERRRVEVTSFVAGLGALLLLAAGGLSSAWFRRAL